MMPVIRINDATFADLSTLRTWFKTKSPGETIDRIVREAMEQLGMERDGEEASESLTTKRDEAVMQFKTAPGLSFTKPMAAQVAGMKLQNPTWGAILHAMISQIKAKGFEGEKLVSALNVPAKAIKFEDDGYRYRPDLCISVQGQSAVEAWKEVDRLAKKWRIPVVVEFTWRQNPKAQHPGKNGVLTSGI